MGNSKLLQKKVPLRRLKNILNQIGRSVIAYAKLRTNNLGKKYCIFINGRFLTQTITGVQRYALELISSIDTLLNESTNNTRSISYTLLVPHNANHLPDLKNISIKKVGRLSGHLWEQFELPFFSRSGLLVGFCNTGPLLKLNQIVSICDASIFACPSGYSKAFRMWHQNVLPILGRNSKQIITISQFSKNELIKYCGFVSNKISLTLLGVSDFSSLEQDKTILDKYGLNSIPYVLAVSSMNPNKNFASLVKAVECLGEVNFKVVIAGGTNSNVFGGRTDQLPSFVTLVGYVSDAELHALYSNATCFVFPSIYEGFGLPPLEAMACSCPVIVSTAASLPEVCGDAALYCDPYSPADIAEKINRLIDDSAL
ncbi:MAG: glycosyltransferase family 1 protein, partial [Prolixibacteraceae bacterium]|nr:glycosyltransferase family 1 protein [Prolixibacteraceae bacterium]